MDCRTARLLLEFSHPTITDLEASETAALQQHLATCGDCDSLACADRQIDSHLGHAVRAVPIPIDLRDHLLLRLEKERALRRRRSLAWSAGIAAAAAILLPIATLGAWLYLSHRPAFDVAEVIDDVNPHRGQGPEVVEEWFQRKYAVTTAAPPRFNYALLTHYDLAMYQGQRIPMLLFIRDHDWARVYILSSRQFNLDDLSGSIPTGSGGQSIIVWRDPEHPDLAYLIIHTGESLRPFLTGDHQPLAG